MTRSSSAPGFAGLYMLHRLRGLGLSARVYRGGQRRRRHLVLEPLPRRALRRREPWTTPTRSRTSSSRSGSGPSATPPQPEILRYLNHVADRFDLRRDIQFDTRVTAATFDEAASRWTIETDRGDRVSARFCIMATGCLSAAQVPDIPGLETFAGRVVPHGRLAARGRRLHRPARRRDRHRLVRHPVDPDHRAAGRAPHRLPAHAELQRARRTTAPLDPEYERRVEGELRRRSGAGRARSRVGIVVARRATRPALEVTRRGARSASTRRAGAQGGFGFSAAFNDLLLDEDANDTAAEFVRAKIREIVHDPEVAEMLSPTDYPFGTKRLCVDTATTRRSTATTSRWSTSRKTPIEAITPTGLRTARRGVRARQHRLRHRLRRDDRRAAQDRHPRPRRPRRCGRSGPAGPRTYLGLMVAGFPNLFTITGPGSPSVLSNMSSRSSSTSTGSPTASRTCASTASRRSRRRPRREDAWVEHVNEVGEHDALSRWRNSWYLGRQRPRQAARVHAVRRRRRRLPREVRRGRGEGLRGLRAASGGARTL